MNFEKVFYEIEDDIDYNCLSPCIDKENKTTRCGSYKCTHECKNCLDSGKMIKFDLKTNTLDFNAGWIICAKCYNKYTWQMKLKRLLYKIKILFKN